MLGNYHGNGNSSGNGLMNMISQQTMEYAVGQLLGALAKASDGNYRQIVSAFRRFAGDDENKLMVADWIGDYLSPWQPGAAWLKHLLTSVDPNVRRRALGRFITHVAFRHGLPVRRLDDGREIPVPATVVISPTMRCNLHCVGC